MKLRALVVEDDEKSRRLLSDVLGFHGYEVRAVASGEEALAAVALQAPDVVLLDVELPGISGFEVLEALRRARARIPAVAVTASVMDRDRRQVMSAGFDAYVPKPVNIRELLATLEALFAREAP